METILIATDFSSAARNATCYGFELLKAMNAKVILFNAYQLPATHPESIVYLPANDFEKLSYQQLAAEAETFDSYATVALKTQSRKGPIGEAILSVAEENNVSFIVIGMKGHNKEMRKYFGSTVTLLSKQSTIPLIVVPEEAKYAAPKTIALASDVTDDTDIHVLNPLKKIAGNFDSRLFVVRVINKYMDEVAERLMRSERLSWYLTSLEPSFEFIKAENVARAMNDFVQQHAVDLITVMPHEHTLMERLFTRSVTKDLIFHTDVPLLIIPYRDNVSKASKDVYSTETVYSIY